MHEYDISLKLLLRGSSGSVLRALTGAEVTRWLDVEMPEMRNTRVDLLAETSTGELIHIELQSTNDGAMPVRMLEYNARIYRLFGRVPRQIVLYVGEAPLRMEAELLGHGLEFRYEIVDIRRFDGEELLESSQAGDNIFAVLMRLRDQREAVRRILTRIGSLDQAARDVAFKQLITLAGLRKLEEVVEWEAKSMPILDDIMDHKVIGRERKVGRRDGELNILRRQIEKRFGPLPASADQALQAKSEAELELLSDRILEAESLASLFE